MRPSASRGGLDTDTAVDVLTELSSFETYDALATENRTPSEAAMITELARRALGEPDPSRSSDDRPQADPAVPLAGR